MSNGTITVPPPTPKRPLNRPAVVPIAASFSVRGDGMVGILEVVPAAATLAEALEPLRADPIRSAVLLDVDGTLAPIVRHADDAQVPEPTRGPLIEVAKRYGVVACVSGRRAATARQIVAIGSIAYIGNHGGEVLRPGRREPELDPDVAAYARRVQTFARRHWTDDIHRLRVRTEDKDAIAAYHWRGAPDEGAAGAEAAAEAPGRALAAEPEHQGLPFHGGRKVLEAPPPVALDKGRGVVRL